MKNYIIINLKVAYTVNYYKDIKKNYSYKNQQHPPFLFVVKASLSGLLTIFNVNFLFL